MQTKNFTSVSEFFLEGLSNNRNTEILLFILILIIYVLALVGNLVIILLVHVDSCLRTPMYFFLSNLSGLEICYVTSTVPQTLAHLLSENRTISFTRCIAQMYIATSLGSTECALLGVMAYDRYLAICSPLLYAVIMNRGRQWQLATVSWAGGFLCAMMDVIATLQFPICGANRINHFFCEVPMLLKLACGNTQVTEFVIFVMGVVILLVPLSVILISYGLILSSVLQMKSAAGRSKAFSTCASHLVVVTLFFGTAIFVYMKPQSSTSGDFDKKTAVFYIIVTPLLNPIIYTLRNKDVHAAVAKVLRRHPFNLLLTS
ncbi:olfactory receptor 2D2-like, partial [Tiliqua scincoides]|uniref:olfactory receptor 2D2-like n=1 Tax=Tiliqua scincoides TaxID=71010 RepID=UPI0034625717